MYAPGNVQTDDTTYLSESKKGVRYRFVSVPCKKGIWHFSHVGQTNNIVFRAGAYRVRLDHEEENFLPGIPNLDDHQAANYVNRIRSTGSWDPFEVELVPTFCSDQQA